MDALITPVDWQRIGAVFSEAMELEPARRPTFVRNAAKGDVFLEKEVMSLLASDELASGFLDSPLPLHELRPGYHSDSPGDGEATRTLTRVGPLGRTAAMPVYAAGDLLAGRFRIIRMLGAGGMGEVFEAEDTLASGARIALKTISAKLVHDARNREAFRAEVLAARSVTHPGVCRVHELHDAPRNGGMFLTMELLEGENLSNAIRQRKAVVQDDAARLFLQIAQAVAAAHQAGILHCDIKLSNVILVKNEKGSRPVVTDFGLARVAARSTGHVGGGTPDYMAPELFNGAPPSFATDVYALGVLAVEVLTGQRLPHRLSDLTGVSDPNRSKVLPGALQRGEWGKLVARCLDNDPARRFRSAGEVSAAVDHLLNRTGRLTRRAALVALVAAPVAAYYTWDRLHPVGVTGLAILPFEDRSPGHSVQFLAESIPSELIRVLSSVPGLKVTALSSTTRYRGSIENPVEIARRLGVDYVLRGTVELNGNTVAMGVEAVSGKTGKTAWKDEFRRGAGQSLALREDVVMAVAGALPIALAPAQLVHLRGQPTANAAAYDKYLLGIQLAATRMPAGLQTGVGLLTEATQLDPGFALAFAQLSFAQAMLSAHHGFPADSLLRQAEASAARALALDDTLPEAHLAMGLLRQQKYFDWSGAEQQFRTAARLNPGFAIAHQALAGLLSNLNRVSEAEAEVRLARGLDPGSVSVNLLYGRVLLRKKQTDEAITQLELASRLNPNGAAPWTLMGMAWSQKGMWSQAEAALKRSSALNPDDDFAPADLVGVYAKSGRLDEANALMSQLKKTASPVALAVAYTGLNRYEDAISSLETAWRLKDPNIGTIAADPYSESLRQFPRFTDLLKKMSLP